MKLVAVCDAYHATIAGIESDACVYATPDTGLLVGIVGFDDTTGDGEVIYRNIYSDPRVDTVHGVLFRLEAGSDWTLDPDSLRIIDK